MCERESTDSNAVRSSAAASCSTYRISMPRGTTHRPSQRFLVGAHPTWELAGREFGEEGSLATAIRADQAIAAAGDDLELGVFEDGDAFGLGEMLLM